MASHLRLFCLLTKISMKNENNTPEVQELKWTHPNDNDGKFHLSQMGLELNFDFQYQISDPATLSKRNSQDSNSRLLEQHHSHFLFRLLQ